MTKIKSKEKKAEEQRSYYFRNKTAIQKRRNKEGEPQKSNEPQVLKAQKTQWRNKSIFNKSFFGTYPHEWQRKQLIEN